MRSRVLRLVVLGVLVLLSISFANPLAVLKDFGNATIMVASVDGEFVAAGGTGGTVVLYNTIRGQEYRRLFLNSHQQVAGLSISYDKLYLAAASVDGSVKVWRVTDQVELKNYENVFIDVSAVALAPKNDMARRLLAVASKRGRVKFFNILGTVERPILEYDFGLPISNIYFAEDGEKLIVVSTNDIVIAEVADILNRVTKVWGKITFPSKITAFTMLNRIEVTSALAGLQDGSIHFVNLENVTAVKIGDFFEFPVKVLAVSSYPKRERAVFAASEINRIPIYDVDTRTRVMLDKERRVVGLSEKRVECLTTEIPEATETACNVLVDQAGFDRLRVPDHQVLVYKVRAYVRTEKRIETHVQEVSLFALDLKVSKDNPKIVTPRTAAVSYLWGKDRVLLEELEKFSNVISASIDSFVDIYYERYQRLVTERDRREFRDPLVPELDKQEFLLLLGTENEFAITKLVWQGEYVLNFQRKVDFYGIQGDAAKLRVTADRSYLLALDGKDVGAIKVWKIENVESPNPSIDSTITKVQPLRVYEPALDLNIIDFSIISQKPPLPTVLAVTDGQEIILLRSTKGLDEVIKGNDRFVPYARFTAPKGASFIGLEFYRHDADRKIYVLGFLDNNQVVIGEVGTTGPAGLVALSTGFWRIAGFAVPAKINQMKVIHSSREAGVLEPYVVSAEAGGRIRVWRLFGDELVTTFEAGALVKDTEALAVSEDGKFIAVATLDSVKIYLFSNLLRQQTRPYNIVEERNATAVEFLMKGQRYDVLIGKENGEVVIATVVDTPQVVIRPTSTIAAHPGFKIRSINTRGDYMITAADDLTIKFWRKP